jgi:hypothetical protein
MSGQRGVRAGRIVFTAVSLLVPCALAMAQGPDSDDASLFVPEKAGSVFPVPLSEFKHADGTTTLQLQVDPRVSQWVAARSGTVAFMKSTSQVPIPFSTGNYTTGVFTLTSPAAGDYVCMSDLLLQDPQVVTHWSSAGQGAQSVGATDGLISVDYVPATGKLAKTGSIESTNPNHKLGTYPIGGEYFFATDVLNLFSDGTPGSLSLDSPAYERFIGENYSLEKYSRLAAIWLSDQVRVKTGLPVAHRNAHVAFLPTTPVGQKVQNNLPLLQVVHGHIISVGSPLSPDPDGSEDSLGTFLLPPGWTAQAATNTYPLFFSGFYDLNGSMFNELVGIAMLDTIEEVYTHPGAPRPVVGVLWNGGASIIAQGCSPSAYYGAAKLIEDAASMLKADPERVVVTGGSRGGTTGLAVASNPLNKPYTVLYANIRDPEVRLGEAVSMFSTPSHRQLSEALDGTCGWIDAFKDAWQEPVTLNTSAQLALKVLFGTTDAAAVDASQAIDSPVLRARLKAEGTRVQLIVGTHDYFKPFKQEAQYINHLRLDAVPLSCLVFYRFGHMSPTTVGLTDAQLLDRVFPGDPDYLQFTSDLKHYQFDSSAPEGYHLIDPPGEEVPFVFEWPMSVASYQQHTWSFIGKPGGRCRVWTAQLVSGWQVGNPPSFASAPVYAPDVLIGFENAADVFGTTAFTLSLPIAEEQPVSGDTYYWYGVNYSPDGDTTFEYLLGNTVGFTDTAVPAPLSQPGILRDPVEIFGNFLLTRDGGVSNDSRYPPVP